MRRLETERLSVQGGRCNAMNKIKVQTCTIVHQGSETEETFKEHSNAVQ